MSYAAIEPTVIDEDIIRKAVNEQVVGEVGEISKREGIEEEDVLCLRLDYKNILKIDNLYLYINLKRLQLDNNIIEKMENISFLVNLEWLDLSFNNISVIEGIEGLTKLTDLTLFNNRITKLENMDNLVNLQVFSIGNNAITALDSFSYLIKFENLRVLHASGNPVFKNPNYKSYCLAMLKNLKYLDYRLIDPEAVIAAKEKYLDSLIAIEEEETQALLKKKANEQQAALDFEYERAHILRIDQLFDSLFSEDSDFKRLVSLAPSIINDIKEEFRAKFEVVILEFKSFVLRKEAEKRNELEGIRKCIETVSAESDKECLVKLEHFYHQKKELIKVAQNSRSLKAVDEALKDLRESTRTLSNYLMYAELVLVDQFEEVVKEFERNYTDLCNTISEYGTSCFARLRDLETAHLERFSEAVYGMYERFSKGDIEDVDEDIRDIMIDKDQLTNAINSTHDYRLSKLDAQEETLLSGCLKDQEMILKEVHQKEVQRNRVRVGEIVALVERCGLDIDFAEENSY